MPVHTEVLGLTHTRYIMDGEAEAQRGAEARSQVGRWSPAELSLELSDSYLQSCITDPDLPASPADVLWLL